MLGKKFVPDTNNMLLYPINCKQDHPDGPVRFQASWYIRANRDSTGYIHSRIPENSAYIIENILVPKVMRQILVDYAFVMLDVEEQDQFEIAASFSSFGVDDSGEAQTCKGLPSNRIEKKYSKLRGPLCLHLNGGIFRNRLTLLNYLVSSMVPPCC